MNRIELPGSDRHEPKPATPYPLVHPHELHQFTVRLKPTPDMDASWKVLRAMEDLEIPVTWACDDERVVKGSATAEQIRELFGVELHVREHPEVGTYVSHHGPVTIPEELEDFVEGVFGLDKRPIAKPHFRKLSEKKKNLVAARIGAEVWQRQAMKENAAFSQGGQSVSSIADRLSNEAEAAALKNPPGTFTPVQVADLYGFPSASGGGQTVAIIELGGGYKPQDLRTYFGELGIATPTVQAVSVNHGKNQPGGEADGEVMLDIEVVGAVAPKATIVVYFTNNTSQGFMDAVSTAIHDTHHNPSVISISWGGPEDSYSQAELNSFNGILAEAAAKGITITVAAGDNGSSDGEDDGQNHVDFPASSPNVLACGGTRLVASDGKIVSEVVWNEDANGEGATGGGYSAKFAVPAWQKDALTPGINGRGVPDVAGNADPVTGYYVRVDGQDTIVGGTSAVAPLYAGLVARMNQLTGNRMGFANPVFYQNPSAFRDITEGNNGAFKAGPGWDPCTGLGTPNGTLSS